MHLKNLAVLKVAEVDAKAFTTVRLAPLYDAVTTRVFPGLGGDRMALKLNGKDDRLTCQDFLALARTIGVSVGDAETAIADLTARVADRAQGLQLPAFADETEAARTVLDKVIALVSERSKALAAKGG
jgi:serine/threonine-protein kinase HipA